MTGRGGRLAARTRLGALLGVLLAGVLCGLPVGVLPAAADDSSTPLTYVGQGYSSELYPPETRVPGEIRPTQAESQSKLWYHADAWWALMAEPTGHAERVYELMPDHTWRPASGLVSDDILQVGDALHDGDTVHVVNRVVNGDLTYVRLTFDPEARDYRAEPPRLVTTLGGNGFPSIVQDGDGRLWVGYANGLVAAVTWSDDGGATWAEMYELARLNAADTEATAEAAALVSYDDRVGILWSHQAADAFEFASHRTGDDPEVWERETALTGAAEADNHISLVRIPGEPADTLAAAVKTSKGDVSDSPAEILIEVLLRKPDGTWSAVPAATVGDELNDPDLQVDVATDTLHLFASNSGGDIVRKQAPLDDISFPRGGGQLFVLGADGRLLDPTTSKEPVDARTGLVVLASDARRFAYRHAEQPLDGGTPVVDEDDRTPPTEPAGLRGRALDAGSLALSWGAATDGDRWVPASTGVPVAGYVVSRDGEELATVTSTFFRDDPRPASATSPTSVRYEVQAVDAAGNRSAPVSVDVPLPAAESSLPTIAGALVLALAVVAAVVWAVRRRRFGRDLATGPSLPEPDADAAAERRRDVPAGTR